MFAPLLVLLCLPAAPLAQEPPPAQAAPLAASPFSADLQAEYLAGTPIVIPITANNPDEAASRVVADLARRPWLVHFILTDAEGRTQRRHTTPPETDDGGTLRLPPRGQRRVLLEIPSGGALKAGEYTLTVELQSAASPVSLAHGPIRITPPAPLAADFGAAVPGAELHGQRTAWVHNAATGRELYLHIADGADPRKTLSMQRLSALPTRGRPVLAAVGSTDPGGGHVVWPSSPRRLHVLRLHASVPRGEPRDVEVPWPAVELISRGASHSSGGVLLPLWVPAPRGSGGDLQLLVIDSHGRPSFRRMGRFDARPDSVRATVGQNGTAWFAVRRGQHLDLYDAEPSSTLPVSGRRLVSGPSPLITERWVLLNGAGEHTGGLSLMVLLSGPQGLEARWIGLQGSELKREVLAPPAEGETAVGLVPNGWHSPGVLLRTEKGTMRYREGIHTNSVPAGTTAEEIVRDTDGRPWVRGIAQGAPIVATPLNR